MVALLPAFVAPVLAVSCPDNGNLTNGIGVAERPARPTRTSTSRSIYQDNRRRDADGLDPVFFDGGPGHR